MSHRYKLDEIRIGSFEGFDADPADQFSSEASSSFESVQKHDKYYSSLSATFAKYDVIA